MDPTVHGYSLTARKPASGVGATWGFAGTTPRRVASMRAYASGASDLSAVSKAPFFGGVMRRVFRHPRRRAVAVEIVVRSKKAITAVGGILIKARLAPFPRKSYAHPISPSSIASSNSPGARSADGQAPKPAITGRVPCEISPRRDFPRGENSPPRLSLHRLIVLSLRRGSVFWNRGNHLKARRDFI